MQQPRQSSPNSHCQHFNDDPVQVWRDPGVGFLLGTQLRATRRHALLRFWRQTSGTGTLENNRAEMTGDYVKANRLSITKYQDYDWEPKSI